MITGKKFYHGSYEISRMIMDDYLAAKVAHQRLRSIPRSGKSNNRQHVSNKEAAECGDQQCVHKINQQSSDY